MPAGRLALLVEKGTTWRHVLTWFSDDERTLPVDLTGWTACMHVRRSVGASEALLELATGGSGITLGGTEGTISIEISAAQTAALPTGSFRYDLEMLDPAGEVKRLLQGAIAFEWEVTR